MKNVVLTLFTMIILFSNIHCITIVKFNEIPDSLIVGVIKYEYKIYGFPVQVVSNVDLPKRFFNKKEKCYSADSILGFLENYKGYKVIGITNKPLYSSRSYLYGLGNFYPLKACVISNNSLDSSKMSDQLGKLAIHELGHTFGLVHCPDIRCFMAEGNGTNKDIDIGQYLCPICRKRLKLF